jgi:pyridoxamine 5'-phosphate oxidase
MVFLLLSKITLGMDLSDLRRDFGKSGLSEDKLPVSPVTLLRNWLEEANASGIKEFNAMVLSTADTMGRTSSRVVLLKELEEDGSLIFYTNYLSRKGMDIKSNPQVSLNFFWREQERQIRIEGKARKTSREKSENYFKSRPLESQLSAIVSPQSEVIKDLLQLKKDADDLFISGQKITLPVYWGGYAVTPDRIEFWQGGKNRLHDRIRYHLKGAGWQRERLAP